MRIRLALILAVVIAYAPAALAQDWYYTTGVTPEVIIPQPIHQPAPPYIDGTQTGYYYAPPSSGYIHNTGDTYVTAYETQGYGNNYIVPNVSPAPGVPYTVDVYQAPTTTPPTHYFYPETYTSNPTQWHAGVEENTSRNEIGPVDRRPKYERGTFGGSYQAGGVFSAGVDSRFGGVMQPGAGRR